MAKTYTLIQAQTLTSTAASVTFSNIPQNYTDLVVMVSSRVSNAAVYGSVVFQPNGLTATSRRLYGDGSSSTANTGVNAEGVGGSATANTFSNITYNLLNYTSSNYKIASVDWTGENNGAESYLGISGHLISTSSPITSFVITANTLNFIAGSTFYLYGVGGTRATGGTITSDFNYTYHTFTSTSTFTALEKIKNAEILLVAGGGSGGSDASGGGGAGGVVYSSGQTFNAGTSYSAIIGAGGAGNSTKLSAGNSGTNTLFSSVTAAVGGGAGGGGAGGSGSSGGSGGGSRVSNNAGTSGQGNQGGSGNNASNYPAGGGGGAGGAGVAGNFGGNSQGGNGGVGTNAYHYWHLATGTGVVSNGTYYIAGGGGGGVSSGTGGAGGLGGGTGGVISPNFSGNATANTGSGSGGAGDASGTTGSGGSGLVIVRYPSN